MRTIVAADLYGVTPALRAMLAGLAGEALFLSPWPTDACPYVSERAAHAAFIAGDGLARYAARIGEAAAGEAAFFVAFSVGASAVWMHAASACASPASAAMLFYGSRIRDYATLTPGFPVHAVFAQSEPAFAPAKLARRIAGGRVRTEVVAGTAHGFMNPLSPGFSAEHCAAFVDRIVAGHAQHRPAAASR